MRDLIRKFANWLLRLVGDGQVESNTEKVVREVYVELGLPPEQFSRSFNLLRTGKIWQIYHISAQRLGIDPEFDTVDDVIKWLES